jgi:hypothetical protein
VTLGTRVRIEILKAMAKCFGDERNVMYVSAFTSRPLLYLRPKEAGPRSMAFTFSDALIRYGRQLSQGDLGEAYKRAGNSFNGQLQQNFVFLFDFGTSGTQRPAHGKPQVKRKMSSGPAKAEKRKKS